MGRLASEVAHHLPTDGGIRFKQPIHNGHSPLLPVGFDPSVAGRSRLCTSGGPVDRQRSPSLSMRPSVASLAKTACQRQAVGPRSPKLLRGSLSRRADSNRRPAVYEVASVPHEIVDTHVLTRPVPRSPAPSRPHCCTDCCTRRTGQRNPAGRNRTRLTALPTA